MKRLRVPRLPPAAKVGVLLVLTPALALGGAGPAITPLVLTGDVVPGVGQVIGIHDIAVNSSGDWLVVAETDAASNPQVLLRNGVLELRQGDAPPAFPPGATLREFGSIALNDLGQAAFNFYLDGPPASEDGSVDAYLDTTLSIAAGLVEVVQEGEPAPDFSPGTPLIGMFNVRINDAGTLLVTASADDPTIPSTLERALYVWTTDPDAGGIVTSTRIAAEGDVLPGQTVALSDLGTASRATAINDAGEVLFAVDIPGGLDAIYHWDGSFAEIAQLGDPSPVPGRLWASLDIPGALDLGAGDLVYGGTLDGDSDTAWVLIRNSDVLIQEGDSLPAIGFHRFKTFGAGPVASDTGDVLWIGRWSDTDDNEGLFLNHILLVQEGVTRVDGLGVIDFLFSTSHAYRISDDGRLVIFRAGLAAGGRGVFLLDHAILFNGTFESGDTSDWSSTTGA